MESARISGFGTTIFSEFSKLALEHQAVNLGQGFPDFDGPDSVKAAAIEAIRAGTNQYAVSSGTLVLKQAIAEHALRFYGQRVDLLTEVVVTSGATEAIFDAVQALVDPGDEVIVFEPFYDSYAASITMAGGVARPVALRPPDAAHGAWWFHAEELEAAFSAATALVIVNTPHNPTGKVFTAGELSAIGALAARHGAVLLSDEVYEHLVFEPAKHVRAATLPGLAERTLTISSGGKSFSFTGWKIGWAIGPAALVQAVQKAHQWVTFATASPFQVAIAAALRLPDAYFAGFQAEYRARRDFLAEALARARLPTFTCEGAYFLMADISKAGQGDDVAFCRWLTREVGVAAIPPSAFYAPGHQHLGASFARFAFCKTQAVLDEAARRLSAPRR